MRKMMCVVLMLCALVLCSCAQQPAKEVNLGDVMNEMMKYTLVQDGMLELTQDDLLELYGIQSADVKQFAAQMCLNSLQADEIILVEAVDAQAAKRVQECLEARYQTKLNETRNYQPEEFAKIEKCKVTVNGNLVSLIVVSDASGAMAVYEKAVK